MIRVSEGETIRLRVKFDPQEEETFVVIILEAAEIVKTLKILEATEIVKTLTSLRTVTALAWLQPATDRRRSTPLRPILLLCYY